MGSSLPFLPSCSLLPVQIQKGPFSALCFVRKSTHCLGWCTEQESCIVWNADGRIHRELSLIAPSAGSDTRCEESNDYTSHRERGSAIWAEKPPERWPDRSQSGPCPCGSVAYLSQQASMSFERPWDLKGGKATCLDPEDQNSGLKSLNFGLALHVLPRVQRPVKPSTNKPSFTAPSSRRAGTWSKLWEIPKFESFLRNLALAQMVGDQVGLKGASPYPWHIVHKQREKPASFHMDFLSSHLVAEGPSGMSPSWALFSAHCRWWMLGGTMTSDTFFKTIATE